ncbi:Beta-catenin-interacting protein 1 [Galemys pyrenaicus]|uniref:Beta-catenin-interacting protein 1 n=1 Tax=Galemys pyrenaicus TaxID=202257 RepID=A0A8J6DEH7_GALPY|nr:Beta-catenin-interacting protein 1 [Galemys pyrenaicus]
MRHYGPLGEPPRSVPQLSLRKRENCPWCPPSGLWPAPTPPAPSASKAAGDGHKAERPQRQHRQGLCPAGTPGQADCGAATKAPTPALADHLRPMPVRPWHRAGSGAAPSDLVKLGMAPWQSEVAWCPDGEQEPVRPPHMQVHASDPHQARVQDRRATPASFSPATARPSQSSTCLSEARFQEQALASCTRWALAEEPVVFGGRERTSGLSNHRPRQRPSHVTARWESPIREPGSGPEGGQGLLWHAGVPSAAQGMNREGAPGKSPEEMYIQQKVRVLLMLRKMGSNLTASEEEFLRTYAGVASSQLSQLPPHTIDQGESPGCPAGGRP